jgi:7,8-dihydropterin-6-yl-methyl-4-(beta-D-ribofuranosyl)aminobenzene 5'-phosphate synthase
MRVFTVYDNICHDAGFTPDWGFSCVVDKHSKRIIFDTGANERIFQSNLEKANISPSSINMMIISHNHWDHTGGALWLIKHNPGINVYIPKTWGNFGKEFYSYTKKINVISENTFLDDDLSLIISKNLFVTEISLIIRTGNGNIIFTGCGHTGVENIAKQVIFLTKTNIFAIVGGFHFFRSWESGIKKSIREMRRLNIKNIIPCHCTGEKATLLLREEFGENCLSSGVGKELYFQL